MTMKIQSPATQSNPLAQEESQHLSSKQGNATETVSPEKTSQESLLISKQSQRIQKIVEAMAKEPQVDMDKVNLARQKIADGTLDIMTRSSSAQESLDRIVNRLMEMDSVLESSDTQDS